MLWILAIFESCSFIIFLADFDIFDFLDFDFDLDFDLDLLDFYLVLFDLLVRDPEC